jgi:potassium channel subfamily K
MPRHAKNVEFENSGLEMHLLGVEEQPVVPGTLADELRQGSFLDRHALKVVAVFLVFGLITFHFVEGFSWADTWYFVCITLTTVGYGDLSPQTHIGRLIAIFYIIFGLSFVASSMGTLAASFATRIETTEELAASQVRMRRTFEVRSVRRMSGASMPTAKTGQQMRTALGILVSCILIGAVFIFLAEGLHPIDALYWAVVTMSSVGYGDIAIKHPWSRIFVSFYALVGVACTGWALGQFARVVMVQAEKRELERVIKRGVTTRMINEMDITKDGDVDRMEFLCYMLVSIESP